MDQTGASCAQSGSYASSCFQYRRFNEAKNVGNFPFKRMNYSIMGEAAFILSSSARCHPELQSTAMKLLKYANLNLGLIKNSIKLNWIIYVQED